MIALHKIYLLAILVFLITACIMPDTGLPVSTIAPSSVPALSVRPTPTPFPTQTSIPSETNKTISLPPGLTLEEFPLIGPPSTDSFLFVPKQGNQVDIMSRRSIYRNRHFQGSFYCGVSHNSCTVVNDLSEKFVVESQFNQDGSDGWTIIYKDGLEIYKIHTGPGSPIDPMRGFWTYDDHWVLETARITRDIEVIDGITTVFTTPTGQISQDGELLNSKYQHDEMFGFQLISGKPFYFFKENGKINFNLDGTSVSTEYDVVPHYGCCSSGVLNPQKFPDMIAFFAQRDDTWFYVELGVFD